MKLFIFLDVDGVLNHEPDTKDCGDALRKFAGDMPQGGFDLLCPKCVERLNVLIREAYAELRCSEVKIVLSSTWRRYFEPDVFTERIGRAGFDFVVKGRTAVDERSRGEQILEYVEMFKPDAYIVLDDDTFDMGLVEHRQIVTNYQSGFDENALLKAINLILEISDK